MIKQDYKNEILPEGMTYRTYNVVGEDGIPIHTNIHFEKAYVPMQVGDNFGAQQINEMAEAVNLVKNMAETIKKENFSVTIDNWIEDETFPDYPYKTDVSVEGVTEEWICTILTPDHTNRSLDTIFGGYLYVGQGILRIWSSEKVDATFENAYFQKVVS